MKLAQVCITLDTIEPDLAQDPRFIALRGKTAVSILDIAGGNYHIFGDFIKMPVVSACGANNPPVEPLRLSRVV